MNKYNVVHLSLQRRVIPFILKHEEWTYKVNTLTVYYLISSDLIHRCVWWSLTTEIFYIQWCNTAITNYFIFFLSCLFIVRTNKLHRDNNSYKIFLCTNVQYTKRHNISTFFMSHTIKCKVPQSRVLKYLKT